MQSLLARPSASRRLLFALLSLGALMSATPIAAQQTWVVDWTGAPGSQFTQIQPAIDAASPGDLIRVRPSQPFVPYWGFVVEKSLRIVGGPDVKVGPGASWWAMGIQNLAPGEEVILVGLEEEYIDPYSVGLVIQNNQGTVHCEDVKVLAYTLVWETNQMSLQNCVLGDVTVRNSQVLMTETTANGYYDFNCICKIPALEIDTGSRVTIAGGSYYGPDGVPFTSTAGPAIRVANGSKLYVTGDFGTTIQGGAPVGSGAPGIFNLGTVVLDPDPAIVGTGIAADITGAGQVTQVRIPYLHTNLQGSTFTTTLETFPGASVRIYYSPFVTPFPYLPTTPDIWVGSPRRIVNGVAPANGIRVDAFQLPLFAQGISFPLQAVVINNGKVYLSNPVVSALAK